MELSYVDMVLSMSLTEPLADNIKSRIEAMMVCNGCIENQANKLGHECMAMNFESRHSLYGDLAILSMDIEIVARDFIERNVQMLNYINEAFLNNLNMDFLIKNACDMYISSDTMSLRMF
ncbi:hypothetical protein AVEN_115630-1 [Araneus ventricosus]|uniref:Uncharacterized protein n=1 Tax=Araneus ventricosus TaxID=182803 RepID=A0A4Y2JQ74_ARAVE|nr:hypothetical protein AVEN_115630-1 [Araneus ventricosus]